MPPTDLFTGNPFDENSFSIEGPSSQMTVVYFKLIKTNKQTKQASQDTVQQTVTFLDTQVQLD